MRHKLLLIKRKVFSFTTGLILITMYLHCTNVNQPETVDTNNNIWLVSITPDLNSQLTIHDTLRVKMGYRLDPVQVETIDTTFNFYMTFKRNNSTNDNPYTDYIATACCSKDGHGWSDTLLLGYPVSEIIKINPQLKPLTFSFQMITSTVCKDGNGICMVMKNAQEYYIYKKGIIMSE